MEWPDLLGAAVAVGVGASMVVLALGDARTGQVAVAPVRLMTATAIVALSLVAGLAGRWGALVEAAVGALLVTLVQLLPYRLQRRMDSQWMGQADVRLGVPMGWTLGWFGIGFAVVGFGAALIGGLVATAVSGRRRLPFVPFLATGYWLAILWALVRHAAA